MLDAKIEGLADLQKELAKVPQKIAKGALRSGLLKAARVIAVRARVNCPVGKTGRLKKSLKWRSRRQKGGVLGATALSVNCPYAHIVHEGTAVRYDKKGAHRGAMPANRFMTRAMDSEWKNSVEAVGIQIKRYLLKKDLR